jgi:hypothetical protein
VRDFNAFGAALPPLPLAGPALGASKWMQNLGPFLSSQPRLGVVTLHRYPLQLCYTSTKSLKHPTLGHLMNPAATTGLADSFKRDVASAHARGLPLRVDEINSVSCGADRAVSYTFASSLWAVDAMFELARVGVDGVNLHTFPGAGYELFELTMADGRWQAAAADLRRTGSGGQGLGNPRRRRHHPRRPDQQGAAASSVSATSARRRRQCHARAPPRPSASVRERRDVGRAELRGADHERTDQWIGPSQHLEADRRPVRGVAALRERGDAQRALMKRRVGPEAGARRV